jgi:hypothetical protein
LYRGQKVDEVFSLFGEEILSSMVTIQPLFDVTVLQEEREVAARLGMTQTDTSDDLVLGGAC